MKAHPLLQKENILRENLTYLNSSTHFLKHKDTEIKKVMLFKLVVSILFSTISFISNANCIDGKPSNYSIIMRPYPLSYHITSMSEDSCIKTYRVCWKTGQFIEETPGPLNLVPHSPGFLEVLFSDLVGITQHVYITKNVCTGDTIRDIINAPAPTKTDILSRYQKCESYTWFVNGVTYSTSGTFTYSTPDTTATLILSIGNNTSNTTTATACDTYTWAANGVTYSASGTYTFTSLNPSCCTNTATLNLTINNSSSSTTTATACDSYTWAANGVNYTASGTYTYTSLNAAGCTNTATLNLTINTSTTTSVTASYCNSYTWNGTTYTASGTYTHTSLNASGCLTTEVLHLTIVTNCNVPTLSEWSLILLFLLSLSSGMVFMYRKERTLSFANGIMKDHQMPFLDKELFTKVLLAMMVLLSIIGAFVFKINGSILITDLIGSFVASIILAFMIQLFLLMKRFEKKG